MAPASLGPAALGPETRLVVLAAALVFGWALLLGVVKYAQIRHSPESAAHPYIDIAHRAALLYSFALVLIALLAQLSDWPWQVDLAAAGVQLFFFVAAIASYQWHGLRRDTVNQFHAPGRAMHCFMVALVVGEIGGFGVLLAGYLHAWLW